MGSFAIIGLSSTVPTDTLALSIPEDGPRYGSIQGWRLLWG